MGTVNPRARGGASLSGELKESRRDREQIRRLFQSQPKPKVAAAAGVAVGNSEAASDTYTADAYGVRFQSWTFTPHDYWPGSPPALVSSGTDEFDPSGEGWYIAQVQVTVYVSGGAPAFARIEVNPDSTANTDASVTDVRPFLTDGSLSFVRGTVTTGPFYHPGAGNGNHFLGAFVTWPNSAAGVVSASASYILSRVG